MRSSSEMVTTDRPLLSSDTSTSSSLRFFSLSCTRWLRSSPCFRFFSSLSRRRSSTAGGVPCCGRAGGVPCRGRACGVFCRGRAGGVLCGAAEGSGKAAPGASSSSSSSSCSVCALCLLTRQFRCRAPRDSFVGPSMPMSSVSTSISGHGRFGGAGLGARGVDGVWLWGPLVCRLRLPLPWRGLVAWGGSRSSGAAVGGGTRGPGTHFGHFQSVPAISNCSARSFNLFCSPRSPVRHFGW
mmetsp:Transcript_9873/g.17449  ORF Transcript_9873/g.17449 Transcript_9873/m.17449 type:complete len:240 (-) Transcript_9873:1740-2459(-)